MECNKITNLFTDRSYSEFAETPEEFLTLYKACLYKSANSAEEFLVIESFLNKFENYSFPFAVSLSLGIKTLPLAEKSAVNGELDKEFLRTKLRSEEIYIPKLKFIDGKVFLYDETYVNSEDTDIEEFIYFGKEYLLFLRFLKIFDYKLDNRLLKNYLVSEKNEVFIRKELLKDYAIASEDIGQVAYSYKDSFNEGFFIRELSKLLLSLKLSGYRVLVNENFFVNTRTGELVFFDFVRSGHNIVGDTNSLNLTNFIKKIRKGEIVSLEDITLKKFNEAKRISVDLIRFVKTISGTMEGTLDA